jgi:phosphoribosylformylglycinamidine synthase subunit PurQ / glutaminase
MPSALVIRAPGTNCDLEVCHGFHLAGATTQLIHIDALLRDPSPIASADLIAFPGGFSYGDDVASGRIFAMKLRERLYSPLRDAAQRGVPMIGICNGFQVLVQVGLLPGASTWPEQPPAQTLALSDNKDARYMCRWVDVSYEAKSACIWTKGLADLGHDAQSRQANHTLPVGHGEGRLSAASPAVLAQLEAQGQVVVRYADNFNGSESAIAGVCDPSGRIFGLMPHPDRFLAWSRHPCWTRLPSALRTGDTPGVRMFKNAVEAAAVVHA